MKIHTNNSELSLEKLLNTINNYKWLIFFSITMVSLLMFINLYFKPNIYSSSSIIEIKTKNKSNIANDFLLGALSFGNSGKTEKEIEVLKTFLIHNEALKKINFQINYYQTKEYRDIELYDNTPIKVKNILIKDKDIIGKKFVLTPKGKGFTLTLAKNPIYSLILESENKKETYQYDTKIENEYFTLQISLNKPIKEPIKFVLNGNNREIYDETIKRSVKISHINPNVPLIKISFEDNIPQRANDYVDAISASFIEISINAKNEQNAKVLTFINQQLAKIKKTLQSSENELEKYKTKNKIIQPSIQANKYIEKLSELEIKLSENRLKQKLIGNLLRFAQNNNNLDAIAPSLLELNDQSTLGLITSLQNLQIKESNLKTELTNMHPKLITVRRQIHTVRNKILYNLKNLKSLIIQRKHSLKNEKISYESKIKSLPKAQKQLVNINRNYQVSSTMYNYLLKKKTESELLIVSTLSDYKIIDKAHVTRQPI
ncbi:MAG TPA: hypothetical protein EYG80_06035, partial [Flavobacteriaceae bacterium]|nr:hypothetical protein [Flavobacteriaceae bacterium]